MAPQEAIDVDTPDGISVSHYLRTYIAMAYLRKCENITDTHALLQADSADGVLPPPDSSFFRDAKGTLMMKGFLGSSSNTSGVELAAQDLQLYICEVQIGSPPRPFELGFDSGSSNLIVRSRSFFSPASAVTDFCNRFALLRHQYL